MWQYHDYLAVSEDFIPVFTEDVDKNHKGNWKFFIPHLQLKEMIEKLIIALERGQTGDKRSLWLTGSYGTGKTFASFVIKHLLEDDPAEIADYFQKHDILTQLWPRFKALRQNNRYLVVYRSSSGHITSNRRLMIEIQQAIKEKLKAQGFAYTFGESIMDQLIEKLTDTNGIINWPGAFQKHRGRFRTVATAEEVIQRLQAGDVKIGEQVAEVLEEEGITLLESPAAVKAWIKEVIINNNLQGIIFIWDEFTEFFTNNVPVTPLQELAQASADMPFYLFLVTHRSLNQFTRIDDETRRKLLDRFHNCQLEMTPVTAYRLIGNAIEILSERQDEWEAKRESLWSKVDVAVLHINYFGERINKEDVKRLTPIHPYTAFLLSTISATYSSSQRTLFQFLKTNEPGSFQWFIANFPKDNWYWLTPDYLWQYFFENIKIETVDQVSDLLTHYRTVEPNLTEEEQRVLRMMLLLTALWRQTRGASTLLKPTLSVMKRMFIGTDLALKIAEVAEGLCAKGMMLAVPLHNDYEYILPTATIDYGKLQQYQQRVENSYTFEKMIERGKATAEFAPRLQELLSLQGAAKLRHPIQMVSAKDLKVRRERAVQGVEKPYEIGVIWVLALEDGQLNDAELISAELSANHDNYCFLVSQAAFGERRWNEWLNHKARSMYHEEMRDNNTKRYYDTKSSALVGDWSNEVKIGRIRAFFRGNQRELVGCDAIPGYLADLVEMVFPDGPEKLSTMTTLYTSAFGKAGAEIGLQVAQNIQRPYRDVVEMLKSQGIWEDGAWHQHNHHPLAKMKRVVDSFFAKQDHVSIFQLWEALKQPPFGLMPSPIGILLFAVLLRNYAQGYYYSDGHNSLPLNANKLAELIEQVVKETRFADYYTIRKLSPQGEQFCQLAREVFYLNAEQTGFPEEARKNLRHLVMSMGYPLWALKYQIKQDYGSGTVVQEFERAAQVWSALLVYDREELTDQELQTAVSVMAPVRREWSIRFGKDRMQEGMNAFFLDIPKLKGLMASLRLDVPTVMKRLRERLNEEVYLWQEERIREKLPEIVRELDLMEALNKLCGVYKQDFNELRQYFRGQWFKGKFPLHCFKEGQPVDVAEAIDILEQVIYRSDQRLLDEWADTLRQHCDRLSTLLAGVIPLTVILVKKFTGEMISEEEATALYDHLPDLTGQTADEIAKAIVHALAQQTKQKKVTEIRKLWQGLTGFDSPASWSDGMQTPIQWVLEGTAHLTFFARFEKIQQCSEKELDEMLTHLNRHHSEMAVLHDCQYVLQKFVQAAADSYAGLIQQAGTGEKLREHIYCVLRGDVYRWPLRIMEIHRLTKQWVHENYKATVYPKVLRVLDMISAEEIKDFVKHLVADDALAGARLLAAIKK